MRQNSPFSSTLLCIAVLLVALGSFAGAQATKEKISLRFAFEGKTVRNAYDGFPDLETAVGNAVLEQLNSVKALEHWTLELADKTNPIKSGLAVTLVYTKRELYVRMRALSGFLSAEDKELAEWIGRLVDPAVNAEETTDGIPNSDQVPFMVKSAMARILDEASESELMDTFSQAFPLGQFPKGFKPHTEGNKAVTVIPLDAESDKNCFLKYSDFELRCTSSRDGDTRLRVHASGMTTPFPDSQGSVKIVNAIKVEIQGIGFGKPPTEAVQHAEHHDIIVNSQLQLFFLHELNETVHHCHHGDVSLAGGGS
ncbi:MAG: hypothetical protein V3W41_17270 [Planctomycetota bacterium]